MDWSIALVVIVVVLCLTAAAMHYIPRSENSRVKDLEESLKDQSDDFTHQKEVSELRTQLKLSEKNVEHQAELNKTKEEMWVERGNRLSASYRDKAKELADLQLVFKTMIEKDIELKGLKTTTKVKLEG